jgi:hypothetical protein
MRDDLPIWLRLFSICQLTLSASAFSSGAKMRALLASAEAWALQDRK